MTQRAKSFFSRIDSTTAIIFAIAFVICGIAWMRFFWVAATNPSPVRYVEFQTLQGAHDAFRQDCAGPSFVDGDDVWRYCEYDDAGQNAGLNTAQWGLVRFDLAHGKAQMAWPLPEVPSAQILALAKAPEDDLAVAWGIAAFGTPEVTSMYRILADGGVEALGVPPDMRGRTLGLDWAGDAIELVTFTTDPAVITVSRFQDGTWRARLSQDPPPQCAEDGTQCFPQMAHHTAEGWRFLYVRAPQQVADPASAQLELLLGLEGGPFETHNSFPLSDLKPDQYVLEDGRLVGLDDLFDRSPGNAVNWFPTAAPFMLHGDDWTRLEAPGAGADFYFSNYRIASDHLHWIPGLRSERGWLLDDWMVIQVSDKGVAVAEMDGRAGATLTADRSIVRDSGAQTSLLPAADGGYWLVGPNGAYVKIGKDMERADDLTILDRIKRAFANFGRLEPVQDGSFYREQKLLKMIAFPLVLLSLPTGYLLVFAVGQARKNTRAWVTLLLRVSALYLALAVIFIWWFWEMTERF